MLKINKNLVGQCDNLIIYLSDPNKQQQKRRTFRKTTLVGDVTDVLYNNNDTICWYVSGQ